MAETKLDQSLEEIVSTQRQANRGGRGRARGRGGRVSQSTRAVPAGGIKKSTRASTRSTGASVPTGPSTGVAIVGDGIQVSNLPKDVSEAQIKEYFVQSVGPVKRVEISYGPGGVSRGIATIAFRNADGPQKAVQALNGLLVDGRPMKIDILLAPRQAAALVSKSLGDRIAAPKNQPKAIGAKKTEATRGATSGRAGKKGSKPRSARPTKKTAEELDSEMADYFEQGTTTADGAAATTTTAATNGDAMEEVL